MKNRALIITLIIILSIIAVLLTILLIYALTSENFIINNFEIKSQNVIFEQNYSVNDIEKINITSETGEVKIIENEENTIVVTVYSNSSRDLQNINFSNTDGELKFSVLGERNKLINFGFHLKDIVIKAPKDALKKITINNDFGDIKIDDFQEATINIDQDCGDVDVGTVKNATIKSSYGDIKINSILNKCDIDSDCGDIKIENLQINENSSIKSDLGDVKIQNINDVYVDAKTDLGDIKVNSNNRHSEITLTIENDCGDIKVNN